MTSTDNSATTGPGGAAAAGSGHVAGRVPEHDEIVAREAALRQRLVAGETVDLADRQALMADIIAAGADTPPGLHRDRLRNLLFQCAANLALETGVMGDVPILAPYVARDPAVDVREVAASAAARATVVLATQTEILADDPPWTRTMDSVLKGMSRLRAGAGGWARGASMAGRGGAPPAAAPDPELDERGRTQELVRWGATARQWRSSRARGLLVTGNALKAAAAFADDDPDIRDFVEASRARRNMRALRALLAAVLIAAGGLFAFERIQHQRELKQLSAQAEAMKMRNDFNDRILAAVDALNRQDIEPLKSLLRDLTGVPGLALDNLTLSAAPSAPQSGGDTAAYAQQVSDPAPAPPAYGPAPVPAVGTCSGYMWIGGAGNSGPPVPDLTALNPGDSIEVSHADLVNLRATPPGEDYRQGRDRYVLGPIVGVVPRGATATLLSRPEAYLRPTGVRYWAKVEVPRQNCSKVYVQYFADASRQIPDTAGAAGDIPAAPASLSGTGAPPQLQVIQDTIAELGFVTVPAERIGTAAGKAELRYYWAGDAALASWMAEALSERLGVRITPVALSDFPVKPDRGVLEVWIDLSSGKS